MMTQTENDFTTTTSHMKSSIPKSWKRLIAEMIYPSKPPEVRQQTITADGLTYEVTRQGEFVQIIAHSLEAESQLREWFNESNSMEERGGVEGFMTTREVEKDDVTLVHMRIKRPTLITESLS